MSKSQQEHIRLTGDKKEPSTDLDLGPQASESQCPRMRDRRMPVLHRIPWPGGKTLKNKRAMSLPNLISTSSIPTVHVNRVKPDYENYPYLQQGTDFRSSMRCCSQAPSFYVPHRRACFSSPAPSFFPVPCLGHPYPMATSIQWFMAINKMR